MKKLQASHGAYVYTGKTIKKDFAIPKYVKSSYRWVSPLIGMAFIVSSATLYLVLPEEDVAIRAAFSMLLVGIFLLFVRVRYDIPDMVSAHSIESLALSLDRVARGLKLQGRGILIPRGGTLKRDKLFIPLHEGVPMLEKAAMDEETVFITEGFSKDFGAFLESPASGIVDLFEEQGEGAFEDIEEQQACSMVKIAEGLDLMSSVDADIEGDAIKITYSHSTYLDTCESLRKRNDWVCERGTCPLCTSLLAPLARAAGRPMRIETIDKRGKRVTVRARFMEWS